MGGCCMNAVKISQHLTIVFILFIVIGLFGCATYQSYSGKALPREMIGLLECPGSGALGSGNKLIVIAIDGEKLHAHHSTNDTIELLPGLHNITFAPYISGFRVVSGGELSKSIWVTAGHTYLAEIIFSENNRKPGESLTGTWMIKVTEK